MKLYQLIFLSLTIYFATCVFVEEGDLSNKIVKQRVPSYINSQNLSSEFSNNYLFDFVVYNKKGDWAQVQYNEEDDQMSLVFYDIHGVQIAAYEYGTDKYNFNEGDLGVSITSTNNPDEVFVVITIERQYHDIDIVGAVINVHGQMLRQDDWITIFSSNKYNYMRPKVEHCGDYIYVIAYANYLQFPEFEGEGDDHQIDGLEGLDVDGPEVDEGYDNEPFFGFIAFNSINISGRQFLSDSQNLEGTIVNEDATDGEYVYYVNIYKDIKITSLGGTKAVAMFNDNQKDYLGSSDYTELVYFIIENGVPGYPKIFDNTQATYPNEPLFSYVDDLFDVQVIPNTNQFVIVYSDSNEDQTLFISTIDYTNHNTICHKGIQHADYFETHNLQDYTSAMNPVVINISETLGYVGYVYDDSLSSQKYFISQFNPSTCEITTAIKPQVIAANSNYAYRFQKMSLIRNPNLNLSGILHGGIVGRNDKLEYTLFWFQTMLNCDQQDETNNICTSCQNGYILTHDGQCITPNCAMDCTQYGLHCNVSLNTCEECTQASHCESNQNGPMCIENQCSNICTTQQDCGQINQFCNLETNQCDGEIIISENIQKIELPIPETVPVVEANNKQTGLLELTFEIEDAEEKQYWLQFLQITLNGKSVFPINVQNKKGSIDITLPRNTYNGIADFKIIANKLIPNTSNASRRQLSGFTTQQIYMEKTVRVVDSAESQIEYQENVESNQNEQIKISKEIIQKQDKQIEETTNTAIYVIVPIMIVGFIILPILGFILGKKQGEKHDPSKKYKEAIKNDNEQQAQTQQQQ